MAKLKKIIVTGPESSGKTELSQAVAAELKCNWHPEYARQYLMDLNRPYVLDDLIEIALAQERERSEKEAFEEIQILDTDITVISIWAREKFKEVPNEIRAIDEEQKTGLYLLCAPDLPWTNDPLRENPHDRYRLFELYIDHLENTKRDYKIIRGKGEARTQLALEFIRNYES